MNKTFSFLVVLCIFSLGSLSAQHTLRGVCGTEGAAFFDRLAHNVQQIEHHTVTERMTKYIPVTWQVIGKSDGTSRVSMKKIIEQMCALNEDFEVVDFHFYIKNIKYTNNTTIFDNPTVGINNGTFNSKRDNAALNIFVANNATPPGGGSDGGVVLGYYDPTPGRDWLVIKKSEISAGSSTLPHEVGHYFSLEHTFYGWEEPYNAADHGTPAPIFSPGGQRTEFMNGDNCHIAADLICDTPPDYNFGFTTPGCNYNGNAMDPNGEVVDPMEENFMSYFLGCSRDDYIFTPQQIQVMEQDYNSPFRAYIRSNYVPQHEAFDTPALLSPTNEAVTQVYDKITFEWENVMGATNAFFEVSRVPSFPSNFGTSSIVQGNSITIDSDDFEFDPDKKYYWRITPYSEGYFCAPTTGSSTFTTGLLSSISKLDVVDSWSVFPNPVQNTDKLTVQIESSHNFIAEVELYNLMGQLVKSFGSQNVEIGDNNFEVAVDGLSAGVYTLLIESERGLLQEKIVVR